MLAFLATTAGVALGDGVADIVAKMPATDFSQGHPLLAQIVKLGPSGVSEVCRMIQPPGKGDDAKARFALHGLALYAKRPGAEPERKTVEAAVREAMSDAADAEVKAFLISQLQLVGQDDSVAALGKLLGDERLCEPAAQALQAIGTSKAAEQLRQALPAGKGRNLVTIVRALGALRDKPSAKTILPHAAAEDRDLRCTARWALANIGDGSATDALAKAADSDGVYERAEGTRSLLLLARRLAEGGDKDAGAKIARDLLKTRTGPESANVRSASLKLLADVLGEGAMADLAAAVEDKNVSLREAALDIIQKMPGQTVTDKWVARANAGPAEVKAAIIAMIGRRGDKAALPVVAAAVQDKDADIRNAGMVALARLSPKQAVGTLIAMMTTDQPAEIDAIKGILVSLADEDFTKTAAAAMPNSSGAGRAALLELLASRGATDQAGVVFDATSDADARVRLSAFRAMSAVAGPADVPRIIQLLLVNKVPAERAEALNAITAVCRKSEQGTQAVLEALPKVELQTRAALLQVLARIGGNSALAAVVAEVNGADDVLRDAAIRALADWQDASAAPELLRLARQAAKEAHKTIALRGYVRVVGLPSSRTEAQTLAMYKEALAVAERPADKKLVLGGLGDLRGEEALKVVGVHLDDPNVVEEAAAAAVKIACPDERGGKGLTSPEARQVMEKVIQVSKNAALVGKARKQLGAPAAKPERGAEGAQGATGSAPRPAPSTKADPGASTRPATSAPATRPLPPLPQPDKDGFILLFNGKDLTGWKGLVGSPKTRAAMTPEQLASAQAKADEQMRLHWKVEDGVLAFDGKGKALCTAKDYGDFEMYVDWKIEPRGDSGIYLRGSPQVQIWQSPVGSGGLYNNKVNPGKPLVVADNPPGQWNRFRIKMVGERVWVWLNGELVVDNTVMENYWERDKPIYPTGQIELQDHSAPLWFRNIYIREIPGAGTSSSPASGPARRPQ